MSVLLTPSRSVCRHASSGRYRSLGRRQFLGGAVGGAVLLGLAGCGRSDGAGVTDDGAAAAPPNTPRVVAIGQGADADALIALGIVPVGMSAGFNTDVYPWTARALDGQPVEILNTSQGVSIEQVAELRPDIIVATTYFQLEQVRAQLEGVATVVGPAGGAAKEVWQQTTIRVGEAVGRADEARRLVADAEATIAAARAAHPAWEGRTFTFGPVIPGQELYTVSSTADASAGLLTGLGLTLAPAVTQLPPAPIPGRAKLSQENLSLLDADVLMLVHFGGDAARAEFESNPLFQQIPAVRRGSYIAVAPDTALAMAFPSVLNVSYAVEQVSPQLDAALKSG